MDMSQKSGSNLERPRVYDSEVFSTAMSRVKEKGVSLMNEGTRDRRKTD